MSTRFRAAVPALLGLLFFLVALEVLRTELRTVTWHTLAADVAGTPGWQLAAALLLTIVNYAVLTGYDFLAFAYVGRRLPRARIALASFLSYAIANNVGFAMISGASVRYRFYTRWGVTADELSRIVLLNSTTFFIGLLFVGGVSLAINPLQGLFAFPPEWLIHGAGWLLAAASVAYVTATFFRSEPIRLSRFTLRLPAPRLALAQLAISVLDWTVAGAVLYALLPASDLSFSQFLRAFLAAQLLALASHVPGGVGVFEGLMVLFLKPFVTSGVLLPALIVYRAVYYLLPLALALVTLIADEARQRRTQAARLSSVIGRLNEQITPHVVSVFTFLAGAVLLFSGATPAAAGRLAILDRALPLGVIETSHFAGSVVGVALLVVSQGLARRLDAAYFLAVGATFAGILTSLLKGADYEEATLLTIVLLMLWRARPAFDRRAALFDTQFSPGWVVAIAGALGASVWLGLFAFKHVEYSSELWWQFELSGEASRALRASVGAAMALLLFGGTRLIRHRTHEVLAPSDAQLDAASTIIAGQTSTRPNLIYLRDKGLIFDDRSAGFVMYGVEGRTWVALGDPVGGANGFSHLIRLFLERCDDFGGVPVFYEIGKTHLHHYADFGLAFVKLGEEAMVNLQTFTLDGGAARRFRYVVHQLDKSGATFRVVASGEVPRIIDQLRAVSDDWIREKAGAEKGFSLGFFDPDYLARFPVALIEREGRVIAFASLWPGARQEELSVDLMRYQREAPRDVMEALLVHLMTWGRTQGYQRFSLGMAPLSGFETSPVAPLWTRLGSFLYAHGDVLYNFQGVRTYKEKFHPDWQPRYLAYPGGLKLPRILADVSALIAGGYRRIFIK